MTGYYCPFSRWSHNRFVYLRASSKSHRGKVCSSPKRSFVKQTMTCHLISWRTCSVFMVKEPRRVERSELCKTCRLPKSKHIKEKWSDHEVKYEMLNSINTATLRKPGTRRKNTGLLWAYAWQGGTYHLMSQRSTPCDKPRRLLLCKMIFSTQSVKLRELSAVFPHVLS